MLDLDKKVVKNSMSQFPMTFKNLLSSANPDAVGKQCFATAALGGLNAAQGPSASP